MQYSRQVVEPLNHIFSPFALVIFGATGDLTKRKLLPALFHLYEKKLLPQEFFIIGFSRRNYSVEQFRDYLKTALIKHLGARSLHEELWNSFSSLIYYQQGDFENEKEYHSLIALLKTFDDRLKSCVPRFFYLATPPSAYDTILDHLHTTKLSEGCGQGSDKWTKVMIEKPFGRNLQDAKNLDMKLARVFKEEQIYRIDHYLGKETVQNIISFRYGNTIFDPLWNKQYIDHVQITIAETVGVETRGNFYEGVGALRDMAQSHLLELMAAIAMKPKNFDTASLRDARAKIIQSVIRIEPEEVENHVVRGQYGTNSEFLRQSLGQVRIMNNVLKGYRQEENVGPESSTETFVALKLNLSDSRWHGVPFYLRTGKRLAKKVTQIDITLKESSHALFGKEETYHLTPNVLTFRIEPEEGITLSLNAKEIGLTSNFREIPLSFDYDKQKQLPEAYERLLLDAMRGEQTLFTRTDEVAASWEFISRIQQGWEKQGKPSFPNYTPGSWGPVSANELIEKDGRKWVLR